MTTKVSPEMELFCLQFGRCLSNFGNTFPNSIQNSFISEVQPFVVTRYISKKAGCLWPTVNDSRNIVQLACIVFIVYWFISSCVVNLFPHLLLTPKPLCEWQRDGKYIRAIVCELVNVRITEVPLEVARNEPPILVNRNSSGIEPLSQWHDSPKQEL